MSLLAAEFAVHDVGPDAPRDFGHDAPELRVMAPIRETLERACARFRRVVAEDQDHDAHTLLVAFWTRSAAGQAGSSAAAVTATQSGVTYKPPMRYILALPYEMFGGPEESLSSVDSALEWLVRDVCAVADQNPHAWLYKVAVKSSRTHVWHSGYTVEVGAGRTVGFWRGDAKKELMERTWAPRRVMDWCLPHDDVAEIRA